MEVHHHSHHPKKWKKTKPPKETNTNTHQTTGQQTCTFLEDGTSYVVVEAVPFLGHILPRKTKINARRKAKNSIHCRRRKSSPQIRIQTDPNVNC